MQPDSSRSSISVDTDKARLDLPTIARVVSDYATFAYLADVFVLESHRGRGLGKVLISTVMAHPSLQGLRRWMLATRDAHHLYSRHGFTPLVAPDRFMELHSPGAYTASGPRHAPSADGEPR